VVITKLNEDLLRQIAEETGGLYFQATPSERETEWIYQHMQNLEKKEFKQKLVAERENHFQLFLVIALILLILEWLVGETKKGEKAYV
jgi:Ca-activated chloride channel family protein